MHILGFLVMMLSIIHFMRFGKASQSDDEKTRASAGMWIFAGVMTILTGYGIMQHSP